jgi:methyltransferase (TIGR00027 family)
MGKYRTSTAGFTCFSRACAAREAEPFRGADHLAETFLPGFASLILNVPPLRKMFMRKVAPSGIYEYVMARTRVFDHYFAQALRDGFTQVVIMGAGMDTRALRFAHLNHSTRVFELDIPRIQQAKLEIYQRKAVKLPPELVFVSADLNIQDLTQVLAEAGFRKGKKTLFLCEGLFMYLNAEAVDSTLKFIRESTAGGSRLVFDYVLASVLRREHNLHGEQEIYEIVSRTGEGWTFGIEAGQVKGFLTQRGFALDAHYSPQELTEKYLTAPDGSTFGPINGTHSIVSAICVSPGK